MTSYRISYFVDTIHEELGLTRGVLPRIEKIYEHEDNSLHVIASKGWKNIGPSIFRVIRELEAGVLTTGQGLDYIKDIVPHSVEEREV